MHATRAVDGRMEHGHACNPAVMSLIARGDWGGVTCRQHEHPVTGGCSSRAQRAPLTNLQHGLERMHVWQAALVPGNLHCSASVSPFPAIAFAGKTR